MKKMLGHILTNVTLLLDSKRGIGWTYDDKLAMRSLPIWDGEGFVGSVEFDYRKDADGKPEKDKPIAGFLLVLPSVYGVVRIKRMKRLGG